jgi:hypothetical protein
MKMRKNQGKGSHVIPSDLLTYCGFFRGRFADLE